MAKLASSLPPASDPRGRSTLLSVRVPPETASAIKEIVQRGKTPYESLSDFVRAAIQEHLQEIGELGGDGSFLPPVLALLRQWAHRTYQMRVHEMLLETLSGVNRELTRYCNHSNLPRALAVLEETCDGLVSLEDEYWQRCCLDELFEYEVVQQCLENKNDLGQKTAEAHRIWLASQI